MHWTLIFWLVIASGPTSSQFADEYIPSREECLDLGRTIASQLTLEGRGVIWTCASSTERVRQQERQWLRL